jgi:AcrR family transcriptional regulator
MGREYHSPVRQARKLETQHKIFAAIVRVVLDEGLHAFTVQRVATTAGVSIRTVYRHFKTRDDLITGLHEHITGVFEAEGVPSISTPDEFSVVLRRAFQLCAEHRDIVRALDRIQYGSGRQAHGKSGRDRAFRETIDAAFPEASEAARKRAWAAVRVIANTHTFVHMTDHLGLTPEEAGDSASAAIELVLADLRRQTA